MNREQTVSTVDDLLDYFRQSEKPLEELRVGTEHEKIGILADTWERIPYGGERGIAVLLERIAARDGWERVYERGNLIALAKDAASITLEPGGQIELSGAPLASIRETCREFSRHVDLVKEVSAELGIVWLALGADPLHRVSEIPHMPKARYDIMRDYLPSRGELALEMMHATATVQANFDYATRATWRRSCAPAWVARPWSRRSSPTRPSTLAGRAASSRAASRSGATWIPTAAGCLPFVFEGDFGYRDYAEWALDVPMFFVVRDKQYLPAAPMTFRHFLANGFQGHRATLGDWDTHLTTLFPEVRLKRVIEVRGADAVPPGLICALPALWKGVLYDAQACEAAWKLVDRFTPEQREELLTEVPERGLAAMAAGRPILDLARELTEISSEGLRRIAARDAQGADERSFLDPVREVVERGASPGEVILAAWRGEWQGSMERLIEASRY